MRKVLNTDRIREIGWSPKRNFVDELKYVYKHAKDNNLFLWKKLRSSQELQDKMEVI